MDESTLVLLDLVKEIQKEMGGILATLRQLGPQQEIEEWRIVMRKATDKAEKIQSRIGSIRIQIAKRQGHE